jgi:hypothetical protein
MPPREAGDLLYEPSAMDWDRARKHRCLLSALEAAEGEGADAAAREMWRANERPIVEAAE